MSLNINQLSYIHPDREVLFENINLSVAKGEKVSLIGNNGSGKSTLLKIIAGNLPTSAGEIVFSEKPYYVPQHFGQFDELTVAQVLGIDEKLKALHAILKGDASEQNFNLLNDDWSVQENALSALQHWNVPHVSLSQEMSSLSGGEKTKVFLSGINLHFPDIVLLDEPTNHLDKAGRKKLYEFIQNSNAGIIVVSHDRTLLNLLDTTYEIHRNGIEAYGGNYEFYKIQKEEQLNALQEQLSEKEKELRKAKKIAREAIEKQEKHGVRGEKANQKKGVPKIVMGNLKSKSEKSSAKLKEIHTGKMDNILGDLKEIQQKLPSAKELKIKFEDADLHNGKVLITAKDINFGYSEKLLWEKPQDFQIRSGERIVINGRNGSGKTTLIKLLLNDIQPIKGEITRTEFSYVYLDQDISIIDNSLTVLQQIEKFNSRNLSEHELKILLHRFLFPYDTWDKTCEKLSGGEKIRLVFCCLQVKNNMPDLFILDEPTNNLDIQSIEIITSVVKSYKGTVLIISHDEYFIQEIGINREIQLE
ncbi:ABC transporter ATP-binding protein [Paludibacter sp. 221]|uniref:ABC-F family ATP-binding cassette domain-containing protein n=1 Tax=Paludibacter sp. 221 TaxID=2302939 RepID=UPI0013D04841|nr:ABC-F family ATP-binding cassette domain-containing protein [Paludibacter sp. 221]NDV47034.1 ABC transporter ATP-binding protein [Paludibacter sp. 221]